MKHPVDGAGPPPSAVVDATTTTKRVETNSIPGTQTAATNTTHQPKSAAPNGNETAYIPLTMTMTAEKMVEIRQAATDNIALLQRLEHENIDIDADNADATYQPLWEWCRLWHHLHTSQPMPSKLQKAQGKILESLPLYRRAIAGMSAPVMNESHQPTQQTPSAQRQPAAHGGGMATPAQAAPEPLSLGPQQHTMDKKPIAGNQQQTHHGSNGSRSDAGGAPSMQVAGMQQVSPHLKRTTQYSRSSSSSLSTMKDHHRHTIGVSPKAGQDQGGRNETLVESQQINNNTRSGNSHTIPSTSMRAGGGQQDSAKSNNSVAAGGTMEKAHTFSGSNDRLNDNTAQQRTLPTDGDQPQTCDGDTQTSKKNVVAAGGESSCFTGDLSGVGKSMEAVVNTAATSAKLHRAQFEATGPPKLVSPEKTPTHAHQETKRGESVAPKHGAAENVQGGTKGMAATCMPVQDGTKTVGHAVTPEQFLQPDTGKMPSTEPTASFATTGSTIIYNRNDAVAQTHVTSEKMTPNESTSSTRHSEPLFGLDDKANNDSSNSNHNGEVDVDIPPDADMNSVSGSEHVSSDEDTFSTEDLILNGMVGIDAMLMNTDYYSWCYKKLSLFSKRETRQKCRLLENPAFNAFRQLQSQQEYIILAKLSSAREHIKSLKAMTRSETDTFWETDGSLRDWVTHTTSNLLVPGKEENVEVALSFILGTIPSFCTIFQLPFYPTSYVLSNTSRIMQSVTPFFTTHTSTNDTVVRSTIASVADASGENNRDSKASSYRTARAGCLQQGEKNENTLDHERHLQGVDSNADDKSMPKSKENQGRNELGGNSRRTDKEKSPTLPAKRQHATQNGMEPVQEQKDPQRLSKRPRLQEEQAVAIRRQVAPGSSLQRNWKPKDRFTDGNANNVALLDKFQGTAFYPAAANNTVCEEKDDTVSDDFDLLDLEGCDIGFLERAFDSGIMPNAVQLHDHNAPAKGDESNAQARAGNEDYLDFIDKDELKNMFNAFKQDRPYEGETNGKPLHLGQRESNDTASGETKPASKHCTVSAAVPAVVSKPRTFKHKFPSTSTKPAKKMRKSLPKAGKKKLPKSSAKRAEASDALGAPCYKRIPNKFLSNPTILMDGMRLAAKGDEDNLNQLHCYVRKELLEVFVLDGSEDGQHRVGLRCVYCGCLPKNQRGGTSMSIFFPKSVEDLYRAVCTWQRIHFKACKVIPEDVKDTYWHIKDEDRTRGKKAHWINTAKAMGFRNLDSERSGVVWSPTNQDSDAESVASTGYFQAYSDSSPEHKQDVAMPTSSVNQDNNAESDDAPVSFQASSDCPPDHKNDVGMVTMPTSKLSQECDAESAVTPAPFGADSHVGTGKLDQSCDAEKPENVVKILGVDVEVGTRVYAEYPDNGFYYWGKISKKERRKHSRYYMYDVLFDDGDIGENISGKNIYTEERYEMEMQEKATHESGEGTAVESATSHASTDSTRNDKRGMGMVKKQKSRVGRPPGKVPKIKLFNFRRPSSDHKYAWAPNGPLKLVPRAGATAPYRNEDADCAYCCTCKVTFMYDNAFSAAGHLRKRSHLKKASLPRAAESSQETAEEEILRLAAEAKKRAEEEARRKAEKERLQPESKAKIETEEESLDVAAEASTDVASKNSSTNLAALPRLAKRHRFADQVVHRDEELPNESKKRPAHDIDAGCLSPGKKDSSSPKKRSNEPRDDDLQFNMLVDDLIRQSGV